MTFMSAGGVEVAGELVDWRRGGRGVYKPFLDRVGGRSSRVPRRPVRLRQTQRLPHTLTLEQVALLLAACEHQRDRFLIALLAETGMRIGQALGLRHADVVSREATVCIVPRDDNANGARAKCRDEMLIPVSAGLVRLYSSFLESRHHQDVDDYGVIDRARRSKPPLTYEHVDGDHDPLLWLPDSFAWLVGARGDWRRRIEPTLTHFREVG